MPLTKQAKADLKASAKTLRALTRYHNRMCRLVERTAGEGYQEFRSYCLVGVIEEVQKVLDRHKIK